MCKLCARRAAILAAIAGVGLLTLVGADLCASCVVSAGTAAANYGAAALAFVGM